MSDFLEIHSLILVSCYNCPKTQLHLMIFNNLHISALSGLRRSEISVSVIAGIVVVRNFLLPLIGIGIVKAAHHFGLVGSDSLYQFILLLQYALPPAMAIGTRTSSSSANSYSHCFLFLFADSGSLPFFNSYTLYSCYPLLHFKFVHCFVN